MTENEPLNERSSHSNGKIVAIDNSRNGVSHTNGKIHKEKGSPVPEHIEAPCCRDIHGSKEPPDGGMRAWLVMISAFLCNGVIFGIINTYGVIHKLLTERLQEQGDADASSKAALVGSLTIGTTFLLSPVAGCLTDKIGLRLTTLIGGVLSSGGLLLSSFFTDSTGALYVTYGIMFGLGAALAYTPTLAILGHYFKRYLGKVSGFVTAGSSVFTVILPPGMDYLIKSYDLETTLRIMSAICTFVIVCSFVYKPLHPPPEPPKKKPGRSKASMLMRSIINVEIWKRKKYVIWALCIPMALFGYFVPYVHMMKFVQMSYPNMDENLPVMSIGITSGLGRLIFGAIADLPGVNRIYLQQLSLMCIGVVTILLPLTSSYVLLIIFSLIMGLFDGCFISLLGPIAYEICGPSGATQAIGFLLGLSSLPLTIGPPIAGIIFDKLGSYTIPFILAGIPPIIGSAILFLMRFVKDAQPQKGSNGIVVANGTNGNGGDSDEDVEKNLASKQIQPLMNGHSKLPISSSSNGSVEHRPESETQVTAVANGQARLADSGINTKYSTAFKRILSNACASASAPCDNECSNNSIRSSNSRSDSYANPNSCSDNAVTNKSIDIHTALVTPDCKSSTIYPINSDSSGASICSVPGASNVSLSQQRQYKYSVY